MISKNCPDSSEAVFGTWALGGAYWGPQNHSDSVKAIHAAIRGGINHFDTAPVYGRGTAEQLIGQQLRKKREEYIISTKCFFKETEAFEKSFSQSLKRLNTNYIDIFYIHWPQSHTDMRPVMELLESYRKKSLIRAIGVSNFSVNQMKEIMEAGTIDIMQCGYNLFWRKEENELLPFCRKEGIRTAAYSILAQGLLTGKFDEIPKGELYEWRRKMVLFNEKTFPRISREVTALKKTADKFQMSSTEASIFWTKENELIDCSIIGCRNRVQTEENLNAFEFGKNEKLIAELETISDRANLLVPKADNIFNHKG